MIVLEYYPHITDQLFEYAPFASLFVMSHVCRAWRRRVAAHFHHLYEGTGTEAPVSRFFFRFTEGAPAVALYSRAEQQLLRHCRVLDCRRPAHLFGVPLCNAAVRYLARDSSPGFVLDAARKLVTANFWGYVNLSARIETAVVVQRFDYNAFHFEDRETPPAPHVVYIFDHQERGDVLQHGAVWAAFANVLGTVRCSGARLTLVGVERLYHTNHRFVPIDVETDIQRIVSGELSPERLKARTMVEYREHIGEEEFAIETGWCDGE